MPSLQGIDIKRAWRYSGEAGKIHYMIGTADGGERHLWEPETSELGAVLQDALEALGYEGPSAEHEDRS